MDNWSATGEANHEVNFRFTVCMVCNFFLRYGFPMKKTSKIAISILLGYEARKVLRRSDSCIEGETKLDESTVPTSFCFDIFFLISQLLLKECSQYCQCEGGDWICTKMECNSWIVIPLFETMMNHVIISVTFWRIKMLQSFGEIKKNSLLISHPNQNWNRIVKMRILCKGTI